MHRCRQDTDYFGREVWLYSIFTCLPHHQDDTVRVIWAYDALDPVKDEERLRKHDHRGTRSLYLRHPQPHPASSRSFTPTRYWDVLAPEVCCFTQCQDLQEQQN